jgi:hypothetical protein
MGGMDEARRAAVSEERILIDLGEAAFDNAVLGALECDTGTVPIMGEIKRRLKIAMRKEKIYTQRVKNLQSKRTKR